jgi:hypothetical protein
MPGTPRSPAVDDMFTIDPLLDASIAGISYFMHRNTPITFTRNADSNSATLSSASGFGDGLPPALLNAASKRPNLPTVASTRRSTEAGSLTLLQAPAPHRRGSCRPRGSRARRRPRSRASRSCGAAAPLASGATQKVSRPERPAMEILLTNAPGRLPVFCP